MIDSRFFFFATFTFLLTCAAQAQDKRDYQWIIGYDHVAPQDEAISLNFNYCPVDISPISTVYKFHMEGSNTSMSDKDGNLLFYSNGCYIVNAAGKKMENGDTINPGLVQTSYCDAGGSPWTQGVISIPAPGSDSLYYVFNLDMDLPYFMVDPFIGIAPERLYYQVVDMSKASGLGRVIAKAQIAVQDTFGRGNIQAVRHANGVDWWVITPKSHSNCYFLTLVTAQGVQPSFLECAGKVWNDYDTQGQAVFTPDGKKFIRFNPWNSLNIYDFDNETGSLSNPIYIDFPNDPLTFHVAGVAVSPNSRYLYSTAVKNAYQFDLQAQDIAASKVLIAEWDGYSDPYPTIFYLAALAPDNKIYIAGTSSHRFLHVIHYPDSAGIQCGFEQRGVSLPSYNFATIPNFPQYRSVPTPVDCDSIVSATENAQLHLSIKIYPNPTTGLIFYEISEAQSISYIEVYDLLGRQRLLKEMRQLDGSVDLGDLEDGIYMIVFRSGKSKIWIEKMVKIK
jgi:Secretion system C-terminal sorting domain